MKLHVFLLEGTALETQKNRITVRKGEGTQRGKKKNKLTFLPPLGPEEFSEGKEFFSLRILELSPLEMI